MGGQRQSITASRVRPGQIWLIEQAPDLAVSMHDCDALSSANVIIYDRALTALVERLLPLGTYAEPLSPNAGGAAAPISPRALAFAADGWGVVQLVEARCGMRARLRGAAKTLVPLGREGGVPVQLIARTTGGHGEAARLRELPRLIDAFDEDDFLTLVFGPIAAQLPVPALAFTANGLAG